LVVHLISSVKRRVLQRGRSRGARKEEGGPRSSIGRFRNCLKKARPGKSRGKRGKSKVPFSKGCFPHQEDWIGEHVGWKHQVGSKGGR